MEMKKLNEAYKDNNSLSGEGIMSVTELKIEHVRIDGGTQNRMELDQELVSEYSKAMYDGTIFPPIDVVFDGAEYWLVDGFHRYHASRNLSLETIKADVLQGTHRDAQLISFGVNSDHGKRRSNADKRKAVMAMLADSEWCQWASNQIAKACGVSHTFVDRVRSESVTCNVASENSENREYITKHGTTAKMKTANIGKKANPVADALAAGEIEEEDAKAINHKPKSVRAQLVKNASEDNRKPPANPS